MNGQNHHRKKSATNYPEYTLKIMTFEEAAEEFFTDRMNEASRKLDYWSKSAEGKSPLSKENILVEKYADEMNFYIYALNRIGALPVKEEDKDNVN